MRGFVKRDANHAEIVEVLKRFGCSVYDAAHAGASFPDLVVGLGGHTYLIEIKSSEKAPLTPGQVVFAASWRGSPVVVLRSTANAVSWATNTRHELRRQSAQPCQHRALTPLLVVPERGPRGEYHGPTKKGE
jgi:Holliday junction resolvase